MTETLTWETLDWNALDRLREQFLRSQPSPASYWNSLGDLANYDFTYGQRIGWKWEAVLRELTQLGWAPPPGPWMDWGCGSGMAARRAVDHFEAIARPACLRLFDRSSLALEFAAQATRRGRDWLSVEICASDWLNATTKVGTLLVSHVLNELDEAGGRMLRQVIDQADAVLWVEPGTYADSRSLIALRETLKEQFHLLAPCPHAAPCGLLAPENEGHWCHHFAASPLGIMSDSNWVRFAHRAGIDLRRLPYSYLVMERKGVRAAVPGLLPEGWSRLLGEPRIYKGFAKLLSCQNEGVCDLELQKRVDPNAFKTIKTGDGPPLWRFTRQHERIVQLTPKH